MCDGSPNHREDVRIATGGHWHAVAPGEPLGLAVRATCEQSGIENLDRVCRKQFLLIDVRKNTIPELLKRVRNDGDPTKIVDTIHGFPERQLRGYRVLDADRKDVSRGTCDLHSGNTNETVVRCTVDGSQAGIDLVVISNSKSVESDCCSLLEQLFHRIPAVVRTVGVGMELDGEHALLFGEWEKSPTVRSAVDGAFVAAAAKVRIVDPFLFLSDDIDLCEQSLPNYPR